MTSLPLLYSFPQLGGNRLRAAFLRAMELFNSLLMTYNSSRGFRNRRAYACRFPGTDLAWGRQNRGREQSLNPVNQLLCSTLPVLDLLYLQRRCQSTKSFNQLESVWLFRRQVTLRVSIHSSHTALFTFLNNSSRLKCAEVKCDRSKTNSDQAQTCALQFKIEIDLLKSV